jgi:regulator of RNase E activity RraA
MMTGKDRVMVDGTQVTVSVGNRQVRPDDMIVGDASGVVVVPKERAEEVLEIARAIEAAENAIMEAVRGGASIAQARRAHGYHTLQTKG